MDVQAEESYKELLRFLRYYRNFGTPIIIGGWAVYFYNPYFGSVDIDVGKIAKNDVCINIWRVG
jgi:hypothetical protein